MPQGIMWKACLRALTRTLSGLHRRNTHRCSLRNSALRQRNCLHSPNTPSLLFASTISSWENACFLPASYYILSLWVSSGILQPLQLQTSGLGERSQLLGGVSRVHHWEHKQRVFWSHKEVHSCTQAGTAPAPGTCQNRGRRPCTAALQLLNPTVELDGNVIHVPKALPKHVITSL